MPPLIRANCVCANGLFFFASSIHPSAARIHRLSFNDTTIPSSPLLPLAIAHSSASFIHSSTIVSAQTLTRCLPGCDSVTALLLIAFSMIEVSDMSSSFVPSLAGEAKLMDGAVRLRNTSNYAAALDFPPPNGMCRFAHAAVRAQ